MKIWWNSLLATLKCFTGSEEGNPGEMVIEGYYPAFIDSSGEVWYSKIDIFYDIETWEYFKEKSKE